MTHLTYMLPQMELSLLLSEAECDAAVVRAFIEQVLLHRWQGTVSASPSPKITGKIFQEVQPHARLPQGTELVRQAYRYQVYATENVCYFLYETHDVVAVVPRSAQPSTFELYLPDNLDRLGNEFAFYFFYPMLEYVLAHRGIFALHAAAISAQAGTAVLLGASAAGKTTLALELLRQGGQLASEDRPLLREHDSQLEIVPGFGAAKVTPQTIDLHRDFIPPAEALPSIADKFLFNDRAVFPSDAPIDSRVRTVILLRRGQGSGSEMSKISGAELLREMLELELFVLLPNFIPRVISEQQFLLMTAFANQVDAYVLQYQNEKLKAAATRIMRLIS